MIRNKFRPHPMRNISAFARNAGPPYAAVELGSTAGFGGDLSLVYQLAIDVAGDNIGDLTVRSRTIDTPTVRSAARGIGREIDDALVD